MNVHVNVHVDKDDPIEAEPGMFLLRLDGVTLHFGSGERDRDRPVAVAAICDSLIERLMAVREAAIKRAVSNGRLGAGVLLTPWGQGRPLPEPDSVGGFDGSAYIDKAEADEAAEIKDLDDYVTELGVLPPDPRR